MKFIKILILVVLLMNQGLLSVLAQTKTLKALRSDEHIRIDGVLKEAIWKDAEIAGDFIQYSPFNGNRPFLQTEIKVLYDETALYIGAMMYDPVPDSIYRELGLRDSEHLNADFVSVDISPYHDGLNAFSFMVTASGVQIDSKVTSSDDEDTSWDAVWQSKVSVVDSGWMAEIKIPYSALRFSKTSVQNWGINFFRNVQRIREVSVWNFVDISKSDVISQMGNLTDLFDIQPPLRLSLMPYVSGYLNKDASETNWNTNFNYGLDLKYGLNQSFTLDMTLIPDFGQVASDDQIYNLTPYEVFYQEQRPFFTEGTELFQKGGVLYSRRIGDRPDGFSNVGSILDSNEVISDNPEKSNLINASKFSGRTKSGLGIGVFNAMTSESRAILLDTITGKTRKYETQPFTNYSMVVLDQNLKNNSYVSIYNTNVYSGANYNIANVSGTEFSVKNKGNNYAISGRVNVSQEYHSDFTPEFGHLYDVSFGKISGNFRASVNQSSISEMYNQNDLGYLKRNNLFSNKLNLQYNIYQPFWKLLNWKNVLTITHNMLYAPRNFTDFSVDFRSSATTNKHLSVGFSAGGSPVTNKDYFEPRVEGWHFNRPKSWYLNGWISPDYRLNFVVDANAGISEVPEYKQNTYWIKVNPRIRLSRNMMVIPGFAYTKDFNSIGYVSDSVDVTNSQVIIFGRRNLTNITTTIQTNFILSLKQAVSFRLRHYWLKGNYNLFYNLMTDGNIIENEYQGSHDFNYNIFNIDISYSWEFAPGSHISVVWKNAIENFNQSTGFDYSENVRNIFDSPSSNSLSVKILYYLDYQYLK